MYLQSAKLANDAVVGVDFVSVKHLSSANKQIAGGSGKKNTGIKCGQIIDTRWSVARAFAPVWS